jgi:hypothetical protein
MFSLLEADTALPTLEGRYRDNRVAASTIPSQTATGKQHEGRNATLTTTRIPKVQPFAADCYTSVADAFRSVADAFRHHKAKRDRPAGCQCDGAFPI